MSLIGIPDVYSGSLVSALVLALDIVAVYQVIKSNRPQSSKVLWALLILLFPVIGVIIYFLFEKRERRRLRYISIP
ncbi:hypothetical protein B0O80DRAFT_494911 [Mortierella sp. GBAus27b]|nr:hypothetical protein B0O80DRAFT_494911 [Mortierella sp. GBAus27b]